MEWVAVAALALSILSLGWQINTGLAQRPRIMIDAIWSARLEASGDGKFESVASVLVTLVNRGGQEVTVTAVLWEQPVDDAWARIIMPGPKTPYRLGYHDVARWSYEGPGGAWEPGPMRIRAIFIGQRPFDWMRRRRVNPGQREITSAWYDFKPAAPH